MNTESKTWVGYGPTVEEAEQKLVDTWNRTQKDLEQCYKQDGVWFSASLVESFGELSEWYESRTLTLGESGCIIDD